MTILPASEAFPNLSGAQVPHHLSVFEGVTSLGEKAVTLAGRAGKASMPWQADVLDAMLRLDAEGMWTHPDSCLIVPRQNGKSLILVLRCLFGLFVLGERIVYSAQRWPTAEDTYKRLWSMINARPSLNKRVVKNTCSQGKGYVELESGATIVFCTRSNDSGRGLDEVDLIVYDESYNLTDGEIAALSPTQMASRNPQTIYASSAVNAEQHVNGLVLSALRKRGLAGEEGLYLAEWTAPDEMPRDAEATWQYANPSYGVIQTAAKIRKLMRGFSTAAGRKSFDVEVLGRGDWPVDEADVPALIAPELWAQMGTPRADLHGSIALALDMTPDRKTLSIAAATRTTDDAIHLEVGYHGTPTHHLIGVIVKLVARWDPCALVIDRTSPAMSLAPDLLNAGIEAETTNAAQMVQACGGFYDDATAGLLHHTGDPLLAEALDGATKRDVVGGGWAWKRTGATPIAPLVAATLAHWGLVNFGLRPPAPVQKLTRTTPARSHRSETATLMSTGF